MPGRIGPNPPDPWAASAPVIRQGLWAGWAVGQIPRGR